jgi:predicted dehydrogenase
MKKYRIGIIGYGGFGKFLHHWWDKLDNVEIVAISDYKLNGDDFENCKFYKSWKELINADEIDIVSIVTPPAFHVEMACATMRANKHVLLEKPIAITNEGAQEILQVQKETGKIIVVDHMLRYNPIVKAFAQISKNGSFGKLRHVVISNYAQDSSLSQDHWFWDKKLSGGIFVEHGVHFIDIVNALTTQKYKQVFGCSHNRNEKQQDQVSAMVLYNGGLIASHYHSFSSPGFFEQTTIRLKYDLAKIEIEGWIPMKGTIQALINESTKDQLNVIPGWKMDNLDSINNLEDISRPEGWGDSSTTAATKTYCGGIGYDVGERASGTFEIPKTKAQVYGECLQSILLDLVAKIEDKDHVLRVSIEDAQESLKIAILASK